MARKKAKKDLSEEARIVETYREARPGSLWGKPGEVWGTVKVVEGRCPSGTPYRVTTFTPDRTPEEQAQWEKNVRAACWEFIEDYARHNGWEAAKARFAVG